MTTTPNLDLDDLVEGQQKAATKSNANNLVLDSIVQLWVVDGEPNVTPPTSGFDDGDAWIVPASALLAWATSDDKVAVWQSGWTFLTPRRGWRAFDARRSRMMIFTGVWNGGGKWVPFQCDNVVELTDNSGGTPASAVEEVLDEGNSTSNATINANFASLATKQNAIIAALIKGLLMAGVPLAAEVVDEAIAIAEVVVPVTTEIV
jgi:hypothetical protein